jgi:hypothetical protein
MFIMVNNVINGIYVVKVINVVMVISGTIHVKKCVECRKLTIKWKIIEPKKLLKNVNGKNWLMLA